MAESTLQSFLTCSVCLDIMTEPVSLSCHHSFCQNCLTKHWIHRPSRPCPLCRRKSSKETSDVNFALRELSFSFRQKLQLSEATTAAQHQEKEEPPAQEEQQHPQQPQQQRQFWFVCSSHRQVPPLFCVEESRLLCPLCEFSQHPQHTVVSGDEAERKLKELISSQLQALNEEKQKCEDLQQHYEEIQLYTEKQASYCEQQIRAVFFQLHQFLQEEEKRALSTLRAEQLRTMTVHKNNLGPELERIQEKLKSVDNMIQELKQQLETHSYKPQQEGSLSQIIPRSWPKIGLLLDQAEVLGNLGFKVWTRIKREVKYQPVVLDPNSASRWLYLSEDLSSVRHTGTLNKYIPDCPERFINFTIVLGSLGYSSGTHQWDVEVGDYHEWSLGVVKESVERKQKCRASPENGFLLFGYKNGKYQDGVRNVKVTKSPVRIRVKLDFNRGTLSFSDADADHLSPLCTHIVDKGTCTEKLFPYFGVGRPGDTKTQELRICEVQSGDSQSIDLPFLF